VPERNSPGHDDDVRTLFLVLPGNVRAEVGMAAPNLREGRQAPHYCCRQHSGKICDAATSP